MTTKINTAMLPKSLHTVRILRSVAQLAPKSYSNSTDRVLWAAEMIGYPNARKSDPLIVKAIEAMSA